MRTNISEPFIKSQHSKHVFGRLKKPKKKRGRCRSPKNHIHVLVVHLKSTHGTGRQHSTTITFDVGAPFGARCAKLQKSAFGSKSQFGGFLKWGYPQLSSTLMGCSLNYKPTIWGCPHLWKFCWIWENNGISNSQSQKDLGQMIVIVQIFAAASYFFQTDMEWYGFYRWKYMARWYLTGMTSVAACSRTRRKNHWDAQGLILLGHNVHHDTETDPGPMYCCYQYPLCIPKNHNYPISYLQHYHVILARCNVLTIYIYSDYI